MPTQDDAQKARAARLRAQIDRLKKGKAEKTPPAEPDSGGSGKESPRDFIHRRMREQNKK